MAVARAKGRLRGKQPKLSPRQEAHLVELYRAEAHTIGELEELFPVTRSTIYRAVARADGREAQSTARRVMDELLVAVNPDPDSRLPCLLWVVPLGSGLVSAPRAPGHAPRRCTATRLTPTTGPPNPPSSKGHQSARACAVARPST